MLTLSLGAPGRFAQGFEEEGTDGKRHADQAAYIVGFSHKFTDFLPLATYTLIQKQ